MIVAELSFPLRGHAPFGLQHLLGFIRTRLVTLIGIEVLQSRSRLWPHLIGIIDGMVAAAHSSHARALRGSLA